MKLKEEFIFQEWESDNLLIPTGTASFSGLMRGNKTFGVILSLLQKETTKANVISAMRNRFDAPEEVITKDVEKTLEELRAIGALDE